MLGKYRPESRGILATASPHATEAGLEMLRSGGNAIDAAVAAAFALAVCEPSGSGLGGQATLLVCRADGEATVLDGHSRAPAAVSLDRVDRIQQHRGYRACTIPSMPATLGAVHMRFGRLPWSRVLGPAIRLAEDGYPITRLQRRQALWCAKALRASQATAQLFLKRGKPYSVGETFRQPALAATLHRLAREGVADFYNGSIARAIDEDMRLHGGLLTSEDLAGCRAPSVRRPWLLEKGARILTTPPPGGGPQLLLGMQLLNRVLPQGPPDDMKHRYALLAEVVFTVFRERFHPSSPPARSAGPAEDGLYDQEYIGRLSAAIAQAASRSLVCGRQRAGTSQETHRFEAEEPGETTHLCAADAMGNVVSLTQSLQSLFGAKVANAACGFLYNNYLTTCPRESHPHQLAGGCMPRSNAAPTIVLPARETGTAVEYPLAPRPFLALGAAGSRRITSALIQVLDGVLRCGMPLDTAVAAPRIHALVSRKVWLEQPAASPQLVADLTDRFRAVRLRPALSYSMGAVQAIRRDQSGKLMGAADPRREGTAASCAVPEAVF